jgi:hypothetical protein
MAYYNYKHVRDSIPAEFREPWEQQFKAASGREYEGTADYDGDLWLLASDYIDHLKKRVTEIEEWTRAAESVHVTSPGAMQQAKHMAAAACDALGLTYVETAPSDIRSAIARLSRDTPSGLHIAKIAELQGRVRELEDVLDLVSRYADTYGADLVPTGPDSYGEGVRAAKRTLKTLLTSKAPRKAEAP